jgi:hypothetical protein
MFRGALRLANEDLYRLPPLPGRLWIYHLGQTAAKGVMKTKRTGGLCWWVFASVFLHPRMASANVGTPLMWFEMGHLAFGNLFIGLFEGLLIAQIFSLSKGRTILIMIGANYFSAWLGLLVLNPVIVNLLPVNLETVQKWFWFMVVVAYLITLLIEWPFVLWCLRGKQKSMQKSINASILAQSSSYILLFGFYWLASGASIFTEMKVVPVSQISLPSEVTFYYISPDGSAIRRMSLAESSSQEVCKLKAQKPDKRLFIKRSTIDPEKCEVLMGDERGNNEEEMETVIRNVAFEAIPQDDSGNSEYSWFADTLILGRAMTSDWRFYVGFWPIDGLQAKNKTAGKKIRLNYETPFGRWVVRSCTHLPGDKAVFKFGYDQICVFDPETKKVALIAKGHGPVALIEKNASVK